MTWRERLEGSAKALTALLGAVTAVGVAVAEGLAGVQTAASEVVPLLTALGVYIVPNRAADGSDGDGD